MQLRLYSVSDEYIAYLRQEKRLQNVFDNKEHRRSHTRKYLGVAFERDNLAYYIPFSTPKNSDYIFNPDGSKTIRKSIIPIVRMTTTDTPSGDVELKGTLKLSNMIPVPKSELIPYDIGTEADQSYRAIVSKEYDFIRANSSMILKNATVIYNQKTKEESLYSSGRPAPGYLQSTVDFRYAEERCKAFILEREKILEKSDVAKAPLMEEAPTAARPMTYIERLYAEEFPAIRHISAETVNALVALNESRSAPLTLKELRHKHEALGKQLESSQDKGIFATFRQLDGIIGDLNRAQLAAQQEQAKNISMERQKQMSIEIEE